MAIELVQDIMVTNMCVKFGEDWTHTFQELDQKQSSGRTDTKENVVVFILTRDTINSPKQASISH